MLQFMFIWEMGHKLPVIYMARKKMEANQSPSFQHESSKLKDEFTVPGACSGTCSSVGRGKQLKGHQSSFVGQLRAGPGQYHRVAAAAPLNRDLPPNQGLAGRVCQKRQRMPGGVISRNVLVAHDNALFGALKVQCESTGVLSITSQVSMRTCLC